MAYINGKNAKLFMTTENASASIVLTGSTAATAGVDVCGVALATYGIGELGEVTGTESACNDHKIKFVEGIDYRVDFEEDSYKPFGSDQDVRYPIRKNWEITVTRKSENGMFRKLFESAMFGVSGSTSPALHDGTAENDSTSGYRFYLYDGADWRVFYHGYMTPDGYSERMDSSRLNVETIKFAGNYWSGSVATASLTVSHAPY